MKKALILPGLALVMAFSLCACGNNANRQTATPSETTQSIGNSIQRTLDNGKDAVNSALNSGENYHEMVENGYYSADSNGKINDPYVDNDGINNGTGTTNHTGTNTETNTTNHANTDTDNNTGTGNSSTITDRVEDPVRDTAQDFNDAGVTARDNTTQTARGTATRVEDVATDLSR